MNERADRGANGFYGRYFEGLPNGRLSPEQYFP